MKFSLFFVPIEHPVKTDSREFISGEMCLATASVGDKIAERIAFLGLHTVGVYAPESHTFLSQAGAVLYMKLQDRVIEIVDQAGPIAVDGDLYERIVCGRGCCGANTSVDAEIWLVLYDVITANEIQPKTSAVYCGRPAFCLAIIECVCRRWNVPFRAPSKDEMKNVEWIEVSINTSDESDSKVIVHIAEDADDSDE